MLHLWYIGVVIHNSRNWGRLFGKCSTRETASWWQQKMVPFTKPIMWFCLLALVFSKATSFPSHPLYLYVSSLFKSLDYTDILHHLTTGSTQFSIFNTYQWRCMSEKNRYKLWGNTKLWIFMSGPPNNLKPTISTRMYDVWTIDICFTCTWMDCWDLEPLMFTKSASHLFQSNNVVVIAWGLWLGFNMGPMFPVKQPKVGHLQIIEILNLWDIKYSRGQHF